jgi:hypothetical protein
MKSNEFQTLCLASSYSNPLKESINPLSKITETKDKLIKGAETIISDGKGAIKDLKKSAVLKKEAIVGSVKTAAKSKLGVVGNIKAKKLSILKGVAAAKIAKLTAIQAAKSALISNYLATKKAHLSKIAGKIFTKPKGLFEHKLPLKGE